MTPNRFREYTLLLAIYADISELGAWPEGASQYPEPPVGNPAIWVPTAAEVAEWIDYYKDSTAEGVNTFQDAVRRFFQSAGGRGSAIHTAGDLGDVRDTTEADRREFEDAERAFDACSEQRSRVSIVQGQGYAHGRDGFPRFNPKYTAPSHLSMAWYNGWATGDFDRRWKLGLIKLPRSPGVSWPAGHTIARGDLNG